MFLILIMTIGKWSLPLASSSTVQSVVANMFGDAKVTSGTLVRNCAVCILVLLPEFRMHRSELLIACATLLPSLFERSLPHRWWWAFTSPAIIRFGKASMTEAWGERTILLCWDSYLGAYSNWISESLTLILFLPGSIQVYRRYSRGSGCGIGGFY